MLRLESGRQSLARFLPDAVNVDGEQFLVAEVLKLIANLRCQLFLKLRRAVLLAELFETWSETSEEVSPLVQAPFVQIRARVNPMLCIRSQVRPEWILPAGEGANIVMSGV